jgi:hypothetical protein
MQAITGLTCIYDIVRQQWAAELTLDGEPATKRFTLRGPEHAETLVEALEDATSAHFDVETDEVRFVYDLAPSEEDDASPEDEAGDDDEDEKEDDERDPRRLAS